MLIPAVSPEKMSLIQRIVLSVGIEALMDALDEREQALLEHLWLAWARPDQIVPEGQWRIALYCAGRGAGKTRGAAEWIRDRVESGRARYIHLIGRTAGDVRDTMVEHGPSSLMKIASPGFMPVYEPSKRRVIWPNGAVGTCFSAEDPDALRGPQADTVWADEIGSWKYQRETWDMMEFGLRLTGPLGDHPQAVVTTTPTPTDVMKELLKGIEQPDKSRVPRDDVLVMPRASTYDNRANLDPGFFNSIRRRYEGTRIGRQELFAELLEDVVGALWTLDVIERNRIRPTMEYDEAREMFSDPLMPEMIRVVVAIDPPAESKETEKTQGSSSEAGIVAAALAGTGTALSAAGDCYILADRSGNMMPHQWATRAIALYNELDADAIVAEVNNGGDMVRHTIHSIDANIPVKKVRASRGKATRAEPVSAMYEQNRVHHVGYFPILEDQMTTWVPKPGKKSPDRMDALVWAITELAIKRRRGDRLAAAPITVERH